MANINVTSNGTVVMGDNDLVNLNIAGGGDVTVQADPSDNVDHITIRFLDDTQVDNVTVDLSTFSEPDLRIDIQQYDSNDSIGFIGGFDFAVDPDHVDRYTFSYVGADGNIYTGYIRAMDGGEKDFTDPFQPINIICFADGTMIETPNGPVAVETLRPGDLVTTRDSGALPLRWVGRRALSAAELRAQPALHPISVTANAFGPGLPEQDLVLSPNHRVMLSDWRVEMLFGDMEALAAVRLLESSPGVTRTHAPGGVAYNHLMFDRHEIVIANGMPSESLYPGPMALEALDEDALAEIRAIFPEALEEDLAIGPPARRILREFEVRALLSQNAMPLVA